MLKGKKRFRAVAMLLVFMLSSLMFAGCGAVNTTNSNQSAASNKAASVSSPTAQKNETVNVGYLLTPDPQAVAAEKGFFLKQMGATVKFKSFDSGPAAFAALASGSIQFMTVIGNPPTMNAIAKGMPIEVIWAMDLYTTGEGLVVKQNSSIHTLKDLKGKKVAIVTGSTSDLAFSTALEEAGMKASDVHLLDMSPPNMVAAWKSNNIDAAYTWDPAMTAMLDDNGRVVVYDKDQHAPIWNLAVVNTKWADSHKALVEGFIRAEAEGVDYYKNHYADAIQAMAKWNGITANSAKQQAKGFKFISLQEQLTKAGLGKPGEAGSSMVGEGLKLAAEQSLKKGLSKSMPKDLSKYINISYIQAVINNKK